MNVEKANIKDAPEMLDLQKAAFYQEAERYNDFTIQPLIETIEQYLLHFDSQTFLIMRDSEQIVGSVAVKREEDTAFIGRLVVLPNRQGEGIASVLLAEAEELFSEINRLELFTGHLSEKNLAIYRHKGYREFKSEEITSELTFIYMEKENG